MYKYNDNRYLDENKILLDKLMKTAISFSELSKCSAKKVCCILYKNGNIISIGLNGTISGKVNCNEKFKKINGIWYTKDPYDIYENWVECDKDEHHKWSSYNEIHAEANAISKALVPVNNSVAIVTHSPCVNCAKMFITFGIEKVYFRYKYDDYNNVKELLDCHNIDLIQI